MRHLDLFSGIGGFALAARNVGWQTFQFVEIEPYCQKVLAKNFPGVPIHDDITTYQAGPGSADIITAGWPCQDISNMGTRLGLEGDRSGLWYEAARVIGDVRPRVVVLENVTALLTRWMDIVLGNLAEIGYDCEWHCIPAAAVGAPHRRDRSGLLPTPTAQDYGSNSGGRNPGHVRPSLQTMARQDLWPTPKSSPSGPDFARANRPRSGGDDLATAVARTRIPTPTAGDAKSSGSRNTENSKANPGMSLTDFVRQDGGQGRQVATPDANCWKGGNRKAQITDPSYGITPDGGQLNPTWVEWLMGFPIGWTDLEHSETESSRK
jgi:DNA (cytosine-5)-methyltransferase 1